MSGPTHPATDASGHTVPERADLTRPAVPILEAINYIAFGDYPAPWCGPKPLFELERFGNSSADFEEAKDEGRRDLAWCILTNDIGLGKVPLFGRRIERDEGGTLEEVSEFFEVLDGDLVSKDGNFIGIDRDHSECGMSFWQQGSVHVDLVVCSIAIEKLYGWGGTQYTEEITVHPMPRNPASQSSPSRSSRGRPRIYDWDSFYIQVVRIANTVDGLPPRLGELERVMQEWCLENWGREPQESQIREKLTRLYRESGE